jgi:hypothetical protein
MDSKIQPLEINTSTNINDYGSENDYKINEQVDHNQDWEEEFVTTKKLHIVEKNQQMANKTFAY